MNYELCIKTSVLSLLHIFVRLGMVTTCSSGLADLSMDLLIIKVTCINTRVAPQNGLVGTPRQFSIKYLSKILQKEQSDVTILYYYSCLFVFVFFEVFSFYLFSYFDKRTPFTYI